MWAQQHYELFTVVQEPRYAKNAFLFLRARLVYAQLVEEDILAAVATQQ